MVSATDGVPGAGPGLRWGAVAAEVDALLGGAEGTVLDGRRAVDRRRAPTATATASVSSDQHEHLLAPLAAEQPPGPADHRAAGHAAGALPPSALARAVAVAAGRRPVEQRRRRARRRDPEAEVTAERPVASSDSGPAGRAVWSTIRPSRRNTTRSAHAASWASWVTITPATPRSQARAQQAHHGLAVHRVERAGGLVGQQQAPLAHHGPGDRDALALATRQLVGVAAGPLGQAQLARALAGRRPGRPGAPMPSSSSGSATFSAAVSPASRLKSWKT